MELSYYYVHYYVVVVVQYITRRVSSLNVVYHLMELFVEKVMADSEEVHNAGLVVPHSTVSYPTDGHLITSSRSTRDNHADSRHLLESSSTTVEINNLNSHIADDAYLTSPHEPVNKFIFILSLSINYRKLFTKIFGNFLTCYLKLLSHLVIE